MAAALILLSISDGSAEPTLFSRAGEGQKFDAYLVSNQDTGLQQNHIAVIRFEATGRKPSTDEWIVNCNPYFPQVVSPRNVNTSLKIDDRPAPKDRFKHELWFAVCEQKFQYVAGQRLQAQQDCPVDRLVFEDRRSKRQFVSERVAVSYQYFCEQGGLTDVFDRPQAVLAARCRGPYGDTIIEGRLDGQKAHAIYSVAPAAPCCVWYSYEGAMKPEPRWLKPAEVWPVQLGDEWYEIGPSNPPYEDDRGPMGGGNFLPVACRSN